MDSWDMVREICVMQRAYPAQQPAAQGLIDLIDHLCVLPDMDDVTAGMAGMALALAVPDRQRRVYIAWERPWTYAVFLDFCEPAFYGERVTAAIEDVVGVVRDRLEFVRSEGVT